MRRYYWVPVMLALLSFTASAWARDEVGKAYFTSDRNSESNSGNVMYNDYGTFVGSDYGTYIEDNGFGMHKQRADALYRSGRYAEAFREYSKAREIAAGLQNSGIGKHGVGNAEALFGSATLSGTAARFGGGQLEEIDFLMAVTAQKGGMEDAAVRLVWFRGQYPHSVYMPEVRYALGNFYFDSGDYIAAQLAYSASGRIGNFLAGEFKNGFPHH